MELLSKSAAKDNPYFTIAKILDAHSLKGALKIHYLGDFPEQLEALEEVLIQNAPEGPIVDGPFKVTRVSHHKNNVYLLSLAEITNRTAAEALAKQFLAIPKADALELPEETYYVQDLIGFACKDSEGQLLGHVEHIIQGHQDLLVVKTPEGKEHWVPFVFEMVPEIHVAQQEMVLTPAPGLFDL